MSTEYEVRKLNIDLIKIIDKIESVGAELQDVYYQKRYVYDVIPPQKGRWVRLRSKCGVKTGEKTTLTVKEIISREIDGTKEHEIDVESFEVMNVILEKSGLKSRSFQENFRITYNLDEVDLDIDKWPMIPPLVEIEGPAQADLFRILGVMEIGKDEVTTMDIDTAYRDVYGINLDNIPHLAFTDAERKEIESLLRDHYPFVTDALLRTGN